VITFDRAIDTLYQEHLARRQLPSRATLIGTRDAFGLRFKNFWKD
jgi:hypothetical protein